MSGFFSIIYFFAGLSSWVHFLVPIWFDPTVDTEKFSEAGFNRITVKTENMVINDQHMIFDVRIENNSGNTISVNPDSIYVLASDTPFPADSDYEATRAFEGSLTRHYALEQQDIANRFRENIAKQRRKNTFLGLLGVGLVIFDAAADASDWHHEWSRSRRNAAITRDWVTAGGLTAINILGSQGAESAFYSGQDLQYLDREILKKKAIETDGSERGKVFFNTSSAKYFRLIVSAGHTDFSFDFRQATGDDYRRLRNTAGY
jgi:hypothetical protein